MYRLILLLDPISGAIVYHAPSPAVAAALSQGLDEAIPRVVTVDTRPPSLNEVEQVHAVLYRGSSFYITSDENKGSPTFYHNRSLARLRGPAIYSLELLLKKFLDRTIDVDNELDAYVLHSLKECRPEEGKYSEGVSDYAETMGLSQEAAYQELKVRFESRGRTKLLHYAYFQKHIAVINSLSDRTQLAKKLAEWADDNALYW